MRAGPSMRKGVRIERRGRDSMEVGLALCFTYCLLPGSRQRRGHCSQMVWLPCVDRRAGVAWGGKMGA